MAIQAGADQHGGDVPFDPDAARARWSALDREVRRRIIKKAGATVAIAEGQADSVALGWAWVILGPPRARRRNRWYQYLRTYALQAAVGGRGNYWAQMNGGREYDLMPAVRRTARLIERSYLGASPAAPYVEFPPGEELRPEWLRRALWRPRQSGPRQR